MSIDDSKDLEIFFATHGRIEELNIDEEFATHMADEGRQYGKHNVTEKEVREVHSNFPEYFINKGENKRAPIILVGSTNTGRMIVVPIEPTHIKSVWRPVTAFAANAHDIERYQERTKQ